MSGNLIKICGQSTFGQQLTDFPMNNARLSAIKKFTNGLEKIKLMNYKEARNGHFSDYKSQHANKHT
jgi:hypothetical protein